MDDFAIFFRTLLKKVLNKINLSKRKNSNFFVVFNVKIGALFLHETVITNLQNFTFSRQNFRKFFDFRHITRKIQNTLQITYRLRQLSKLFSAMIFCDATLVNTMFGFTKTQRLAVFSPFRVT